MASLRFRLLFSFSVILSPASGIWGQSPAPTARQPFEKEPRIRTDRFGDELPLGVMTRLGTVRFRHAEGVSAPTFSPDGKLLYMQNWTDSAITAWDCATGKLIRKLSFLGDLATPAAFSADGKAVAGVGKDKIVRLWDLKSGKVIMQVPGEQEGWRVFFSPRSHYLALADWDGGFRLLDLPSGKRVPGPLDKEVRDRSKALVDYLLDVAFSPDEKYLILGREKQTPLVWDLASQRLLRPFASESDNGGRVAVLANGQELLSIRKHASTQSRQYEEGGFGTWSEAAVTICRIDNGKRIREFPIEQSYESSALSADGRILATLGHRGVFHEEQRVLLWDTYSGKQIGQIGSAFGIYDLGLSPQRNTLATCGFSAVRLWSVPGGGGDGKQELVELYPTGEPRSLVTALAFAANGRQLISGSREGVIVWDLSTKQPLQRLAGYTETHGPVFTLSPDGRTAIVSRNGHGCRQWRLQDSSWKEDTGVARPFLGLSWIHHCLAYSPSGKFIAVGQVKTGGYAISGPFPPTFLLHHVDTGAVELDETIRKQLTKQDIAALAYSPNSKLLIVACGDRYYDRCRIRLLDLTASAKERDRLNFYGGAVNSLAVSPNGAVLAAGGGIQRDRFASQEELQREHPGVVLWKLATGEEIRTLPGHSGVVHSVAFSPDGKLLASAGQDGTIRIWLVNTWKQAAKLVGHRGPVHTIVFSPDGRTLASGSADTTILLWEVKKVVSQSRAYLTGADQCRHTLQQIPIWLALRVSK